MCIMYTVFFLNIAAIYFSLHVNNCKLIESKHEAAKYVYLICYQLPTEQLSTKLDALAMTYNNLDEFYIVQPNSLLDNF